MPTYNTAFGALPDYKDIVGQQPGQYMQQQPQSQDQMYTGAMAQGQQQQPQQTFAQMQQQGQARPAPPPPQPGQYGTYTGSQQSMQARDALLAQIQQQLSQPTRFDTDAFNQIRQAQAANLQSEFQGQQQFLNEEMARRGLSASSIASGRFGDLLGQQSRALSDLDARLLQAAAETQAQDRLASIRGGMDFAQLAGAQDLAEFEANRVGQAQQFQEALQAAQFGESARQFDVQQALAELLGVGGMGLQAEQVRGDLELRARQLQQDAFTQGRSLDLQEARDLAQRDQFTQEINLRAEQLQQEAALQGRSLDLQEARDTAQREQFYSTLDQNEAQFARTMDEQRELRLQNLGISMVQLEQEALRIQQGDRSLSLQDARDRAEVEYRIQRLQQDASQFGEQLSYQKAKDEAERELSYAKLEEETAYRLQQFGISQQQLGLEARKIENQADQFNRSLAAEQIFRQAEINLRTQQIMMEYERSGQQIDLSYARLEAEKDIERSRLDFNREELTQRQNQFDRTMEETALERELRERLGMRGLDIQEMMADRNWMLDLLRLLGQGGGLPTGIVGGGGGGGGGGTTTTTTPTTPTTTTVEPGTGGPTTRTEPREGPPEDIPDVEPYTPPTVEPGDIAKPQPEPQQPTPKPPTPGEGNPRTWGSINPETGRTWAPGTILRGEGNQRWIWQDSQWVLLGEGPRDGYDTIDQPSGFY